MQLIAENGGGTSGYRFRCRRPFKVLIGDDRINSRTNCCAVYVLVDGLKVYISFLASVLFEGRVCDSHFKGECQRDRKSDLEESICESRLSAVWLGCSSVMHPRRRVLGNNW